MASHWIRKAGSSWTAMADRTVYRLEKDGKADNPGRSV